MNHSHISPAPYTCIECGGDSARYPTSEELEIHIASDHLNYCPYECERCRFAKFPTEFALISHCKSDHGLKEFF
ncbi:zinc finger, C2H2 type, partial [Ancylostoma caninum]